jgi:DNA-binding transcriptional MerR regulator
VAKLTGNSASAIRYYEQIGLLPEPARAAGRRRYDRPIVRTLTDARHTDGPHIAALYPPHGWEYGYPEG